jgi:hypothetical protein
MLISRRIYNFSVTHAKILRHLSIIMNAIEEGNKIIDSVAYPGVFEGDGG